MITLTIAEQVNSILGGNTPVGYDRLVLSPFTFDPTANTVQAAVRMTSVANPDMQPIIGNLRINASSGELVIDVNQLRFLRRLQLSAGQITAVITIIRNAQNALESGLITVGVIAGTQSTGT